MSRSGAAIQRPLWVLSKDQQIITRYRPRFFRDVRGNEHIHEFFDRALMDIGRMPRTYGLFGDPGCGKTTITMTLAREFGCQSEIKEIDGKKVEFLHGFSHYDSSDYLGKDWEKMVKHIIDAPKGVNLFGSPVRVYLFDEAEQLPQKGRTAMFRQLEDPNTMMFFIFCTVEEKIFLRDKALRSRSAIFEVKPLTEAESIDYINWVCKQEKKTLPPTVIREIAREAEGAPREILSRLQDAFIRFN